MSQQDPFSGMTAFITAAQQQSFSKAGRLLGQTPSSISKAIARLEQDLNVKLFLRSPRLVSLTPEGEVYYEHCKELLATARDARSLVTGQQAEGAGHIRVCLPVSFAQEVIAPHLTQWQQNNTATQIELVLTDRQVDLVQERFDIAIRFNQLPDSRLVAKALTTPNFVTAASPTYFAKNKQPATPQDLHAHSCLGYLDHSTNRPRPWEYYLNEQKHVIQPDFNVTSDQGTFLLNHAIKGGGIMHAPEYLLRKHLESKELIQTLNGYKTPGPNWWIVTPHRRAKSLKVARFIEFVSALIH